MVSYIMGEMQARSIENLILGRRFWLRTDETEDFSFRNSDHNSINNNNIAEVALDVHDILR